MTAGRLPCIGAKSRQEIWRSAWRSTNPPCSKPCCLTLEWPKRQTASSPLLIGRAVKASAAKWRRWAVFAVARAPDAMDLKDRLAAVRPFAADTHFGVREWAWIAARPYLAAD